MLHNHPSVKPNPSKPLNPEISKLCNQYQPALTDLGNARRFAEAYADTVRYVAGRGWYLFVETHWESVDMDTMLMLASQSLEVFLDRTSRLTDADTTLCERILTHIARSETLPKLRTMVRLARSMPDLMLTYAELDADPYLITLRNGTLDLRSGKLLQHNFKHYITRMLPYRYTPEATAPIWEEFLNRLTNSDAALKRYLQRAVGATIFGASHESTAFVLTGPGQRAQQLFLSTLRQLLGSYSTHTHSLKERTLTPTLLTSRLLTSSSSALLRAFDPAILSAFINHEPLTITKHSVEMVYELRPTLWLSAPELPQLSDELAFLRDAIQPIPIALSLSIHEAAQLTTQLQAVLPAIMNWAIEGFQLWYTEAPSEPVCIQEATITFRAAQDPLAGFLAQICTSEPDATISATSLYQSYRTWANASGERPLSASRFDGRILASGLQRMQLESGPVYRGLKLHGSVVASPQAREDEHSKQN